MQPFDVPLHRRRVQLLRRPVLGLGLRRGDSAFLLGFLVAPALFAATIYMELGRIVTLVDGDSYTLIRKKWLTKMFVCGDVLSFMVQSAGECNAK